MPLSAPTSAQSTIECPKCGKHTVVELNQNIYHCINCNFERDLSESANGEAKPGLVVAVITGILMLLVI
jgi:ribosomal protein L37AE/L43A